jgi:hypothetical protein
MLSGRIVERVRMVLENRFSLVLSDVGVPLHQPITRFYSEEAGELVKLGTTVVEDVGSVDNSPPERVPHEEYVGKDLAKARLLMPLKLSRIEQRVEDIEKTVNKLCDNLSDLVVVIRTTFNSKAANDPQMQSYGDQNYIS